MVNHVIESKLEETSTVITNVSGNAFAVLQEGESNEEEEEEENARVDLATVEIEDEEDTKFGQAPSTSTGEEEE